MEKSRIRFAKKSLDEASHFNKNPFIKFIILWIGLNSLYNYEAYQKYREKEKIKRYLLDYKKIVSELISENINKLLDIEKFIDNTPQHNKLREFLRTRRSFLIRENYETKNAVIDFTEFLYQIRNNMFHAGKLWDEEEEAKLLLMVNTVLEKLLVGLLKAYY